MKFILVLAAVVVVSGLFLVPVVPIRVERVTCYGLCASIETPPLSASASVMYAYLGVGGVQVPNPVPNPGGVLVLNSYCFMYGNPGTMCGLAMQRM